MLLDYFRLYWLNIEKVEDKIVICKIEVKIYFLLKLCVLIDFLKGFKYLLLIVEKFIFFKYDS